MYRSPMEIAEDRLLSILALPSQNINRQDAVRFCIQVRSINTELKAKAEALIDMQDSMSEREFIKAVYAL